MTMRNLHLLAAACLGLAAMPALAQDSQDWDDTYLASPQQGQQRAAPPVIGLKRRADYIVIMVSFASDSRDGLVRREEIHAMLLDALGKSDAAGLGLATGSPVLVPLTRANYQNIALQYGGREDTSQASVMITVPLTGTPADAEKRVDSFIGSLKRPGRGTITKSYGSRLVGLRNPEQYRAEIVRLIADDVRANAEVFGPDYRGVVDGIDKPVLWSQVGEADVFLYLPYSYRIVAN
jgi:hypothetical protein